MEQIIAELSENQRDVVEQFIKKYPKEIRSNELLNFLNLLLFESEVKEIHHRLKSNKMVKRQANT
jgi:Trp operon repressor